MDEDFPDLRDQTIEIIKEKMKLNNINQKQLAKKCNLSQPQISKYLNGNESLSSYSIQKLFNAMGYHPVLGATRLKTNE